jgi:hypothetical protein
MDEPASCQRGEDSSWMSPRSSAWRRLKLDEPAFLSMAKTQERGSFGNFTLCRFQAPVRFAKS